MICPLPIALISYRQPWTLKIVGLILLFTSVTDFWKFSAPRIRKITSAVDYDPQLGSLVINGGQRSIPVNGTESIRLYCSGRIYYLELVTKDGTTVRFLPKFFDFFDIKDDGAREWWRNEIEKANRPASTRQPAATSELP
jgi:hypothetical protein